MTEINLDQLIEARTKMAVLIATYGEQYLPIFERIESEIVILEKRNAVLHKALNIATLNEKKLD